MLDSPTSKQHMKSRPWLALSIFNCCQSSTNAIRKIAGAHAPGMPGTFSQTPRLSDPDTHHGTCVTHVPWCMPGSLTSGFLWSRRWGKTFPAFPAHAQPTILRIWYEAHVFHVIPAVDTYITNEWLLLTYSFIRQCNIYAWPYHDTPKACCKIMAIDNLYPFISLAIKCAFIHCFLLTLAFCEAFLLVPRMFRMPFIRFPSPILAFVNSKPIISAIYTILEENEHKHQHISSIFGYMRFTGFADTCSWYIHILHISLDDPLMISKCTQSQSYGIRENGIK